MTYPQTLGGASNRTWLHDFKAGKATFAGHMEPLFSAAKQLADHGVLKASDFTYSATTRLEEFKKGSIAVINYTFSDIPADGAYAFATMPFLGSTDQDAYVYMSSSYWTAIPKRDRTDAETAATEAFVELVSSRKGRMPISAAGRSSARRQTRRFPKTKRSQACVRQSMRGTCSRRSTSRLTMRPKRTFPARPKCVLPCSKW